MGTPLSLVGLETSEITQKKQPKLTDTRLAVYYFESIPQYGSDRESRQDPAL